MGKIAVLILVVVAVMLVLRLIGNAKRRPDDDPAKTGQEGQGGKARNHGRGDRGDGGDRDERRDSGELMMSCSVCGIHVPASDAIFARGKVFCSADHRDAAERHGG